MKKYVAIAMVLLLTLAFGGTAFAMGPDGANPSTVGFVLTEFNVSDSILSPLMVMNWSGTLSPTKTYGEGQPIWFVAHYVQNKIVGDGRDFTNAGTGVTELTTLFTSRNNTVSFSYSTGYMNFVAIDGLNVSGGTVGSLGAVPTTGAVSASDAQLEVTFVAKAVPVLSQLQVLNAQPAQVGNYYLQIMAFTKTCLESQGVVYAKSPVDYKEFGNAASIPAMALNTDYTVIGSAANPFTAGSWLNVYDSNYVVRYIVKKFTLGAASANMANIGAQPTDFVYMVYGLDNRLLIGFISSTTTFKGLCTSAETPPYSGVYNVLPVQYTGDSGGKYAISYDPVATPSSIAGTRAIETYTLQSIMEFFNFSFATSYPVLDKHFSATAGYWLTKEAYYNVASAVVVQPDPIIDIVPKTGDTASQMGLVMIALALAALAATGFMVTRRVRE